MYCFVRFQKGLRSVFNESSQTAWFFCNTSNNCRYIPTNSNKTFTKYIQKFSWWITLSIDENRMKIRAVVFEFIASRQTDRQTRRRTLFYNMYRYREQTGRQPQWRTLFYNMRRFNVFNVNYFMAQVSLYSCELYQIRKLFLTIVFHDCI